MITQAQINALTDGQMIAANGLRARKRGGVVTFDFRYRFNGKRKAVALGPVGITLKQAIKQADELRGNVYDTDVAAERKVEKARSSNTLNFVLDQWLELKAAKCSAVYNMRLSLANHIRPTFGSTIIYDLKRTEVLRHLERLALTSPGAARMARKFLNMALEWWRQRDDAFTQVVVPKADVLPAEVKRDRVLDEAQIADVWHAAGELGAYGAVVRLLLLTGCRRDEIADLEAGELKADRIVIPANRMKGGVKHDIPMLPAIRALLPQASEGRLFPTLDMYRQKNKLDSAIAARCEAAGRPVWNKAEPFVIHDLRRTVRTRLSKLRVDRDISEAILAHARPGLEAVYNQDDLFDARRDALAKLHVALAQIADGTSGANVIKLGVADAVAA